MRNQNHLTPNNFLPECQTPTVETESALEVVPKTDSDIIEADKFVDNKSVEQAANYLGNWQIVQKSRMSGPDFRRKFIAFIENGTLSLPDKIENPFLEKDPTKSEYLEKIDNFDTRLQLVYNKIDYGPASDFGKSPTAVGIHKHENMFFPEVIAVFSDATNNGEALSDRAKDIVAAHEIYHAIVNVAGKNSDLIYSCIEVQGFNDEIIKRNAVIQALGENQECDNFKITPNEIMARMAQLKNYYAMSADETFTSAHLEYAKANYVKDTLLDNHMSIFLRYAKPDTFIHLMNTLPV